MLLHLHLCSLCIFVGKLHELKMFDTTEHSNPIKIITNQTMQYMHKCSSNISKKYNKNIKIQSTSLMNSDPFLWLRLK